jgi:hypothetical protein
MPDELTRGDIDRLLGRARGIWKKAPAALAPVEYDELPILLSVVVGDISRLVRDARERDALEQDVEIDRRAVAKELGNLVLSSIRWADELSLDPWACIEVASAAQSAYVRRLAAEPLAERKDGE